MVVIEVQKVPGTVLISKKEAIYKESLRNDPVRQLERVTLENHRSNAKNNKEWTTDKRSIRKRASFRASIKETKVHLMSEEIMRGNDVSYGENNENNYHGKSNNLGWFKRK